MAVPIPAGIVIALQFMGMAVANFAADKALNYAWDGIANNFEADEFINQDLPNIVYTDNAKNLGNRAIKLAEKKYRDEKDEEEFISALKGFDQELGYNFSSFYNGSNESIKKICEALKYFLEYLSDSTDAINAIKKSQYDFKQSESKAYNAKLVLEKYKNSGYDEYDSHYFGGPIDFSLNKKKILEMTELRPHVNIYSNYNDKQISRNNLNSDRKYFEDIPEEYFENKKILIEHNELENKYIEAESNKRKASQFFDLSYHRDKLADFDWNFAERHYGDPAAANSEHNRLKQIIEWLEMASGKPNAQSGEGFLYFPAEQNTFSIQNVPAMGYGIDETYGVFSDGSYFSQFDTVSSNYLMTAGNAVKYDEVVARAVEIADNTTEIREHFDNLVELENDFLSKGCLSHGGGGTFNSSDRPLELSNMDFGLNVARTADNTDILKENSILNMESIDIIRETVTGKPKVENHFYNNFNIEFNSSQPNLAKEEVREMFNMFMNDFIDQFDEHINVSGEGYYA